MKRNFQFLLKLFIVHFLLISNSYSELKEQTVNKAELYQVGSLQALAKGGYDGLVQLSELPHTKIGLGTFHGLDGEMIALEGVYYKIPTEGHVAVMKPGDSTPFCNLANGQWQTETNTTSFNSLDELKEQLLMKITDKKYAYAFLVTGNYNLIKTRSVPKQQKPYKTLLEVVKTEQKVFELTKNEKIDGDILGFWFPESFKGINITGFHLHFISKDRSSGGHLLESASDAKLKINYLQLSQEATFIGEKPELISINKKDIDIIEKHPGGKE